MNMPEINLTDLISQRELLDKQIDEIQKSRVKGVIEKIKSLMDEYGLTQNDLFSSSSSTSSSFEQKAKKMTKKVLPKYQDEQGNTWSGRGKSPKWLEGKNKASYMIPAESV